MQPTGKLVSLAAEVAVTVTVTLAVVVVVVVDGDRHAGQDGEDQGGVSSSKLMTLRHGIGHRWGGRERGKKYKLVWSVGVAKRNTLSLLQRIY